MPGYAMRSVGSPIRSPACRNRSADRRARSCGQPQADAWSDQAALVSSGSCDATRRCAASDRVSLRPNGVNDRTNGRSCTALRRSLATMTRSAGPHAVSYRANRGSDTLVDGIGRPSKSKQQEGLTDHTAPNAERTVRHLDRTAWRIDPTARSADPTPC
jgi:hypothetical protein